MSGALVQYLLVSLLLAWSLLRVLRQLFPTQVRNGQNRLAQSVAKQGWLRLGAWLQSGQSGAGCGSGCTACGTCATTPTEVDAARPLQLRGEMAKSKTIAP